MTRCLLGVDIGTASTKGVLCSATGEVLASATAPHAVSFPHPGWAEMDARAIWSADVFAVTRELLSASPHEVTAMCVSGIGPCLLLCDAGLEPLRPAILYGIDMRATAEIDELNGRLGHDEIVHRCGMELSSQAVGPKMLWVRHHEPDVWARAAGWYSASSFLVAQLTGEYVLDHHTASQCVPLYDIARGAWCSEWADDVAPGVPMPRLAWPGEVVGAVHPLGAELTGLPEGTPVVAGTVDAWAEALSAGVRRPGDTMVMYGSTMFLVEVLPALASRPPLWTTNGVEPGSYTAAAGMSTSGTLTTWLQRLVGEASLDRLVAEAGATPIGADGLVVLPYFAGERTPVFDDQARGVIAGLSLHHERGHLLRAIYEGTAFGTRQILDLMGGLGAPRSLTAVGGGTRSRLWMQILSDVTGLAQSVPAQRVGASYGGALLAAIGSGTVPPTTSWATAEATVEPVPERAEVYGELFDVYSSLYPATSDLVHRLARLQRGDPGPRAS